jgi:hypothetical protein
MLFQFKAFEKRMKTNCQVKPSSSYYLQNFSFHWKAPRGFNTGLQATKRTYFLIKERGITQTQKQKAIQTFRTISISNLKHKNVSFFLYSFHSTGYCFSLFFLFCMHLDLHTYIIMICPAILFSIKVKLHSESNLLLI